MKIREKISKPLNRKETAYVHLLRILITICQWSQVSVTYRVIIISKFSKLKNLFEQLLACFLLSINVADCFCEWRPKKWFWNPLSSNTKVVNWCSNSRISPMEKQLQTNLFCVRQHKQLEFFFFVWLVSLPTRLIIYFKL